MLKQNDKCVQTIEEVAKCYKAHVNNIVETATNYFGLSDKML